MKRDDSNRDWIVAIPIALVVLGLMVWRRAHTISVQFGYDMWSHAMWKELRFQLFAGMALTLVVALVAWFWRKDRD